jgi:hypothetical protein
MLQPDRNAQAKEMGRKTNNQLWVDPDHPEIGSHNAGNLVKAQRRRGLPSGKNNRVKLPKEE